MFNGFLHLRPLVSMENCGKSVVASCDELDIADCDVFNSPGVDEDSLKPQECEEEEVSPVTEICNEHSLVDTTVRSEEDAFELYNDYAYKLGFSVRKGRQKCKAGSGIKYLKQFTCYKEGKKCDRRNVNKCYSKADVRTNCKAMIEFRLNEKGGWTVSKHVTNHNHELCPANQKHLMRSQRTATKNHVGNFQEMKDSGISIVDDLTVLKKRVEGSSFADFTSRDVYNSLRSVKSKDLDGEDTNALIQIFRWRTENEDDFYFDFEVDCNSSLCSFFWRDGRMKSDYDLFGDLLVYDTTYRTNKYEMICSPFVGMDNHCRNIMFGCGFLKSEKTESFIWLFNTFLKSMKGKHPITLMSNESVAMAAATGVVFPETRHRLCIWHISENSKQHLMGLRSKEDFVKLFNHVLKHTDTVSEFEFHWKRLMDNFCCHNDKWLNNLYNMREKWCPAFNKDFFSGGILSSQRSEATHHAIFRRLSKTSTLCDFYRIFVEVISEWRSNENMEDFPCNQGHVEMALPNSKLLQHANGIYTIEAYLLFEEQFMKFPEYCQGLVLSNDGQHVYEIWHPDMISIRHTVVFNEHTMCISCTCKMFNEVGVLCSHCLRIMNFHCVQVIPDKYILKRWKGNREIENAEKVNKKDIEVSSVWRRQMIRKFSDLISASELNVNARECVQEGFKTMSDKIVADVGSYYVNDLENEGVSSNIKDPIGSYAKEERNVRKKNC